MSEDECTEHLLDEIERLREANFQLREVAEEQQQRIKRLEAAGDELSSRLRLKDESDSDAYLQWIKAKEVKP